MSERPRSARRRRAQWGLALSLAVHVAAPTTWLLSRSEADVGEVSEAATPRRPAPVPVRAVRRVDTRSARLADNTRAPASAPARLRIDAIGINAPVVEVGVLPETGEMEIPADVDDVGWYTFGPAPGSERGSSVLAAHVDSRVQGPGVFFDLKSVEPGGEVVVERSDSTALRYRIVARRSLPKDALPTEELFAREGAPRLVLITCGGTFDRRLRHYRDNVIVYAEPIEEAPAAAPTTEPPAENEELEEAEERERSSGDGSIYDLIPADHVPAGPGPTVGDDAAD